MSLCFFFFSSRRRHTRFDCDWSSDVCSSDLSISPTPRCLSGLCPADIEAEFGSGDRQPMKHVARGGARRYHVERSEEHTSELQSQSNLVCRLLLEKKKKKDDDTDNSGRRCVR